MKRTHLIYAFIFLSIFIIPAYAGETEDMFIPQSSPVYDDFYLMAEAGLIKSVPAEQFRVSPMTDYDAAGYVMEAAMQYAAAGGSSGVKPSAAAKFKKYYDQYRKKAFEIYGKTMEMRKKLANIENLMKNSDLKSFDEVLDEAKGTMFDVENEYAKTTYRGVPPFKVMGMLQARWQDVESFGISRVHHTSLGGTVMSLWTEGIVSPEVSFKLNLNFERPNNEAEKNTLPEYWGTGNRFMDKYTINLTLWGWQINTGFFWEDITPFIAKGTLSDRPALFDRDPYVLEETTKGHFENAFLHSFVKRGDIWSKHGFYGVEFMNMALPGGGQFKIMGGKAEKFDEQYDKLFLYEFAGRAIQPFEFAIISAGQVGFNFFNNSNELAEVQTLAPDLLDANTPAKPYGYIQSCTIYGGDLKFKVLEILNISGELEMGDYYGYLPKPFTNYFLNFPPKFHQQGPALYAIAAIKDAFMVDLEVKFTRIDPNYIAPASAIIDTTDRKLVTVGPVQTAALSWVTYAGDPTLLYNNSSRIDLRAAIELPVQMGFLNLSYGTASQVTGTSNTVTVDHFIFGNRLTGPMWWHLFFSQYGYPVPARDKGIFAYNAPDHPNAGLAGSGRRYITTDKWLTNKELIKSKSPTDPTVNQTSIKYTSNVGVELKFSVHKLLEVMGIKTNNIFLELYGELNTLKPGNDLMPTFDPSTLFSQNIMNAFVVWNVTRKSSLMFDYAVERWTTRHSWVGNVNIPIDYFDQNFGVGFDYDFAPRTSIFLRAKKFMHNDLVLKSMNAVNPAIKDQSFDGWYLGAEVKNFF